MTTEHLHPTDTHIVRRCYCCGYDFVGLAGLCEDCCEAGCDPAGIDCQRDHCAECLGCIDSPDDCIGCEHNPNR